MGGLLSFFIVISISLLILRIGTIILKFTGLSHDVATFQARSAFTGTGFTTRESELVTNHPVRRRIILSLMFVRNLGFVTLVSSLVVSFFDTTPGTLLFRFLWLAGGLIILNIISRIKLFDRFLHFLVNAALKKWTKILIYDYDSLLNLSGEYAVIRGVVTSGSWMEEKKLENLKLPDEGIMVLGITRKDGYYVGTPQGKTLIYKGDTLILYGKEEALRLIIERPKGEEGDLLHEESVKRQKIQEGKSLLITPPQKGVINKFKQIFKKKKKS